MMTMAIAAAGACVYIWQRKPANRALACHKGAAMAKWLHLRLSNMFLTNDLATSHPDCAGEPDAGRCEDLACVPQVTTMITVNEIARAWVTLYR